LSAAVLRNTCAEANNFIPTAKEKQMVDVKTINQLRLESWNEKINKAHATAVLMLAIGHDHVSGQITVITTEDLPNAEIKALLWYAYNEIKIR
jgi:hypothetical protein